MADASMSSRPFEDAGVATLSSSTFDPLAVTPAFARTSSRTSVSQHTSGSVAASGTERLSVPALGDASLMGELPTTDPLSILLQKHLPPHLRPVRDLSGAWHHTSSTSLGAPSNEIPDPFFSAHDQPQYGSSTTAETISEESVRQAAATSAWRKIATLARSKLEDYARGERSRAYALQTQLVDAPSTSGDAGEGMEVGEVLQWWSVRLYALARLRLYSMLRTELAALWQVLSTTSDGAGVMLADTEYVPFTLRVLRATEPKYRGDIRTSVEQYTLLIQLCKQHMRKLRLQPHESRSQPHTQPQPQEGQEQGGVAARMQIWKDRAVRVGLMLGFTLAEGKDYAGAIDVLQPLVESALDPHNKDEAVQRVQLVVVASRVWVQAGDLSTANTLLDRASALVPTNDSIVQPHLAHARFLLAAIQGDFSPSFPGESAEDVGIAAELNSAVTTFYAAKLDTAITALERALEKDPALVASADAALFNTATLYELAAGSERTVAERKRGLLANTARWAGEPGPTSSCFKL